MDQVITPEPVSVGGKIGVALLAVLGGGALGFGLQQHGMALNERMGKEFPVAELSGLVMANAGFLPFPQVISETPPDGRFDYRTGITYGALFNASAALGYGIGVAKDFFYQ